MTNAERCPFCGASKAAGDSAIMDFLGDCEGNFVFECLTTRFGEDGIFQTERCELNAAKKSLATVTQQRDELLNAAKSCLLNLEVASPKDIDFKTGVATHRLKAAISLCEAGKEPHIE